MRCLRLIVAIVVSMLVLGGSAYPMAAQGDGVGFEDLTGLQTAMTRTFTGVTDFFLPAAPLDGIRDAVKPEVMLMLTGVYTFDTEASAVAGYDLLRTDMNATGVGGVPLPLTEILTGLRISHTAAIARDTSISPPVDFTLVMAQDGTRVYTVIAITRGAPPKGAVTSAMQWIAAEEVSSDPATLRTNGTSTGGVWAKLPLQEDVGRWFRGVQNVTDEVPFSA